MSWIMRKGLLLKSGTIVDCRKTTTMLRRPAIEIEFIETRTKNYGLFGLMLVPDYEHQYYLNVKTIKYTDIAERDADFEVYSRIASRNKQLIE